MSQALADIQDGDPFDPADPHAYPAWRAQKLANHPRSIDELLVALEDPAALNAMELGALRERCRRANFAVYQCSRPDQVSKASLAVFGRQLGLTRLDHNLCADNDSISSVTVMDRGRHPHYIPYTDRPLNWHTDGYYNTGGRSIRAFLFHCVRPAARGGANEIMDPEMVYLLLRDSDPDALAALLHPRAMAVPANEENGKTLRDEVYGPVFSTDPASGSLHMRYTARTRSIRWRDDAATQRGRKMLIEILNDTGPYHFTIRLQPGQGIICNNVLHSRHAFHDEGAQKRLMYRARYYDRIANTGPVPA